MAIKVTSRAWTKIRQILHQTTNNIGFVYSASSGGCNGFNFSLHLLDEDTYKSLRSAADEQIRARCLERLPGYMVPSVVVGLSDFGSFITIGFFMRN